MLYKIGIGRTKQYVYKIYMNLCKKKKISLKLNKFKMFYTNMQLKSNKA